MASEQVERINGIEVFRDTVQLNVLEYSVEWGMSQALDFLQGSQFELHRDVLGERKRFEQRRQDAENTREWAEAIELLHEDVCRLTSTCGDIFSSKGAYLVTFEECQRPDLFPRLVEIVEHSAVGHPSELFLQVTRRAMAMQPLPATLEDYVEAKKAESREVASAQVRDALAGHEAREKELDEQLASPHVAAASNWTIPGNGRNGEQAAGGAHV